MKQSNMKLQIPFPETIFRLKRKFLKNSHENFFLSHWKNNSVKNTKQFSRKKFFLPEKFSEKLNKKIVCRFSSKACEIFRFF